NHDLKTNQTQEIARLKAELKEWEPVKSQLTELWHEMESLRNNVKKNQTHIDEIQKNDDAVLKAYKEKYSHEGNE
ncbi:MAG: hypothetical protein ACRD8W_14100, partial [Nitrososphaeraceae archaeon]